MIILATIEDSFLKVSAKSSFVWILKMCFRADDGSHCPVEPV